MSEPRRLPVLVAGVALLGAAAGVAGTSGNSGNSRGDVPAGTAPRAALSSTWSCAGATAGRGSLAPGELLIDNAGTSALTGAVRLTAQDGAARQLPVLVPAGQQVVLRETFPGAADGEWAGAMVNVYGGMGSVYQEVSTQHGTSTEPCLTDAQPEWHFAGGSVLSNAALEISLVNPYAAAAVVDVSFATNEGAEAPLAFQGVVVPPRGLTVLNVASALRQRADVATSVVAQTGRVVAWETQRVNPAGRFTSPLNPALPVPGVALSPGLPVARDWSWASGQEGAGTTEAYEVYNPGTAPARAELELLPGGKGTGSTYTFTVGPSSVARVTTNGQPWALPAVAYAVHLTSSVPVVAERSVYVAGRGIALLPGEQRAWRAWLVAPAPEEEVFSPSGGAVALYDRKVRVAGTDLAAGEHAAVAVPTSGALEVTGSSPVFLQGPAVPLG